MGAAIALPIAFIGELFASHTPALSHRVKWLVSYCYVRLCQRLAKRRFDVYDPTALNRPVELGFVESPIEAQFESPYPESHLLRAADEVFFYGVNSKSECLVTRVARAFDHEAEAWIYLKLANGKIYELTQTLNYQQSSSQKNCFSCGGLQMHYLTPMRKWRIFFSGLLREKSAEGSDEEKMVFVKFAVIWGASSDLFDFTSDLNAVQLSNALAATTWKGIIPPLSKLYDTLNFYSQCGVIHGTVSIGEDQDEQELYLYGERMRFVGETSHMKGAEFVQIFGHFPKNGSFIHLGKSSIPNVVNNLCFGYVVEPDGRMKSLEDADIYMRDHFDEQRKKNDVTAIFHAEDSYQLTGMFVGEKTLFSSNKGWDGSLLCNNINLQLDVNTGSGVVIEGKVSKVPTIVPKKTAVSRMPKSLPLVVEFTNEACTKSELSGGKGSSLGTLTQLSKTLQTYVVPKGFVVSTSAYKEFLNDAILDNIKDLEDVVFGNIEGDVKLACQKVSDEVMKAKMPDNVLKAMKQGLMDVFGAKMKICKFAVRSSATGEDTEQMSAAGQMETFLGVSGLNEVVEAVKKCWASQFGYVATQYKWRNGQVINCPMAVVVQEMIPCDVAGVLFTCDPVTGNPGVISITANYGLGESVVSGTEEPDTVLLMRTVDDHLSVKSIGIGAKSRRIVIRNGQGTDTEDVPDDKRNECCLSADMAMRLAKLAIKIEKHYRSQRDIEWGIWNNNVYILQSRPVTSGTGETDFEIMHEFDGPLRCENEYLSKANVGEVMPGATTPLGLDVMTKFFSILFQTAEFADQQGFYPFRYFAVGLIPICNHMMFTLAELFRFDDKSALAQATMLAFLGRILNEPELTEIKNERYAKQNKNKMQQIKLFKAFVMNLFLSGRNLRKAKKQYKGYHIPLEKCATSKEIFHVLLHHCSDLNETLKSHMFCSQSSTLWNMFVFTVLGKAKGAFDDEEVYGDFAALLASCSDVESADVPAAMQSLAFHIAKDMNPVTFKEMTPEDALHWLQTSTTTAGKKFRNFISKHGHRCIKEFDIRSFPWGTKPESLIKMLQSIVGNVSKDSVEKETSSFNSITSKLKTPLGFFSRLLLRVLLPQSRRAVQERESSKSLLIKGVDCWRKGYHELARVMVAEGRIPQADLLFFLTLDEIGTLLNTRSPKVLARAVHRQRLYPQMDKFLFPEMMIGFPQPINVDTGPIVPTEADFKMKGIAVSAGVAKGYVRIAMNLEEASFLKPGEILLTYCTDIGWTPYFPVLAGVVTELGGLISHGAVVSREYGLPCIAGLHGATRQFQTGDYVLLDGNKGILQKLPDPSIQT